MNLHPVLFGLLSLLLAVLAAYRPHLAVFVWPLCSVIFHATRTIIGAPIYFADVTTAVLMLIVVRRAGASAFVVPGAHAWHWWLLAWSAISAVLASIRYGIVAETSYEFGRMALSFALLPTFAWFIGTDRFIRERNALGAGLFIAAGALLSLEAYEFGNPAGAHQVKLIFLGDVTHERVLEEMERVSERVALRPSGPFHGPTSAAGTALLLGALGWLVLGGTGHLAALCIVFGLGGAALTVSRHAGLAVLGALPFWMAGRSRGEVSLGFLKRVFGLAAIVTMLAVVAGDAWTSRMERRGPMLEDRNISARVVDGPLRYLNAIADDPLLFITGVGPGANKARFVDNAREIKRLGFVSNSFLLPLLYLGFPGFALYLAIWGQAAFAAARFSRVIGLQALAIFVTTAILVASDNYAWLSRPTIRLWLAVFGVFLGGAVRMGRPLAAPALAAPTQVSDVGTPVVRY